MRVATSPEVAVTEAMPLGGWGAEDDRGLSAAEVARLEAGSTVKTMTSRTARRRFNKMETMARNLFCLLCLNVDHESR
jgi:hypothetical protein